MAGSVTQSTNRVFLGGYTMRIEASGGDYWSGWSNAILLQRFTGSLMLSGWLSGEAFTGTSSLKAEAHFFNASNVDLGSIVVWAVHTDTATSFTQFLAQVKRADMPVGTSYVKLRFGIADGAGTGAGIGYVDAVQAVPGEWMPAWTPSLMTELSTLDDVLDGAAYKRVKAANLVGGNIDLASASIQNKGVLATKDTVSSKEIAKDAVTTVAILDANVTGAKIALGTIGTTHIATGAVTATQLGTGAVTDVKLLSSVASLTKVTGGILTGSGSTATLPSGKVFNATAGKVKLRSFTAMPTQLQVDDAEWFAVTAGANKGIYVRVGAVAMNGAGTDVTLL
jgi:hypothetical protein